MVLMYLAIMLLLINACLCVADRGFRERLALALPWNRRRRDDRLDDVEIEGASGMDDSLIDDIIPRYRLLLSIGYRARTITLVLACYCLVCLMSVPPAAAAVAPALFLAWQPQIDEAITRFMGRAPKVISATTPYHLLTAISSMLCAAFLWAGLSICFRDGGILEAIKAYICMMFGYVIYRMGMRLARKHINSQFKEQADEDTILYLRSFIDDGVKIHTPATDGELRSLLFPLISLEEFLSYCAAGYGQLITVGKPGEMLPKAGGLRSYFADDDWQSAIRVTMLRCRGLVLTIGSTQSVEWEIRHIKQWQLLPKCLFVVPPLSPKRTKERIELAFSALGIAPNEMRIMEMLPAESIKGFRVLPNGHVKWLLCSGRDWSSYLTLIATHGARMRHVPGSGTGEGGSSKEAGLRQVLEDSRRLADYREKPLKAPKAVREAVRASTQAYPAYLMEQYHMAMDELDRGRRRLGQRGAIAPEAAFYFVASRLKCLLQEKAEPTLIPEMKQLIEDSHSMRIVWVIPCQAMRETEFRANMWQDIADIYLAHDDVKSARDALTHALDEAAADWNSRMVANIHLQMAEIAANYDQRSRHATQAFDISRDLGDIKRTALAMKYRGNAMAALQPESDWENIMLAAAELLCDTEEYDQAAEAYRLAMVTCRHVPESERWASEQLFIRSGRKHLPKSCTDIRDLFDAEEKYFALQVRN